MQVGTDGRYRLNSNERCIIVCMLASAIGHSESLVESVNVLARCLLASKYLEAMSFRWRGCGAASVCALTLCRHDEASFLA